MAGGEAVLKEAEAVEALGEAEGGEWLEGGVAEGEEEGELPAVAVVEAVCGAGCTLPALPVAAAASEREERLRLSECCVLTVMGGGSLCGCRGGSRRCRTDEAANQAGWVRKSTSAASVEQPSDSTSISSGGSLVSM